MKTLIKKLKALGFSNAKAVSETHVIGVSCEAFRALGLCPFSDIPAVAGHWVDWQGEECMIIGRE